VCVKPRLKPGTAKPDHKARPKVDDVSTETPRGLVGFFLLGGRGIKKSFGPNQKRSKFQVYITKVPKTASAVSNSHSALLNGYIPAMLLWRCRNLIQSAEP